MVAGPPLAHHRRREKMTADAVLNGCLQQLVAEGGAAVAPERVVAQGAVPVLEDTAAVTLEAGHAVVAQLQAKMAAAACPPASHHGLRPAALEQL